MTQYVKDEGKTPLFSKSGKLSGLSQSIYDVLLCGLRGNLKKDAVVAILHDITVRNFYVIFFLSLTEACMDMLYLRVLLFTKFFEM